MDIKIASRISALCMLAIIVGCSAMNDVEISKGHINKRTALPIQSIPETVQQTAILSVPKKTHKLERYTVKVESVPVKELLFSMARDARINIDIDDSIKGNVTLNSINQTLPQILKRISNQTNINFELKEKLLVISADKPTIKLYSIDYLNMSRKSSATVKISTQIAATGGAKSSGGSSGNNNSGSEVSNVSDNDFWTSLTRNIGKLIHDTSIPGNTATNETTSTAGGSQQSGTDNPNIIVNKESGTIAVRATQRQHKQVGIFIDQVLSSARRQVLVEATIAEVTLNKNFQAGIDWSIVQNGVQSVNVLQNIAASAFSPSPIFSLGITDSNFNNGVLSSTLHALQEFGDVKIMSSPKIMAINNQTALLKVVDNIVYFTMEVETTTTEGSFNTTFETTPNTVPVGFVMSVTPFINAFQEVTLSIRPTISRIIDYIQDPNPELAKQNVKNEVPVIQVREIESILKIRSKETAIIGGLMQDKVSKKNRGVPLLVDIPWVGEIFKYRNQSVEKTELVIFIRPVVIQDASLNTDLKSMEHFLID